MKKSKLMKNIENLLKMDVDLSFLQELGIDNWKF